jgi:hypothetical protein
MKKSVVVLLERVGDESSESVSAEYKDIGFLGVCRKLWHFWKHNGTGLDDYNEFRIRIIERKSK